jgi:hypothetical protein
VPPLPFTTLPSCTRLTDPVGVVPGSTAPLMNTFPHPEENASREMNGRAQLVSRNGNPFASFCDLADSIAAPLPFGKDAVLDGEPLCLDKLKL